MFENITNLLGPGSIVAAMGLFLAAALAVAAMAQPPMDALDLAGRSRRKSKSKKAKSNRSKAGGHMKATGRLWKRFKRDNPSSRVQYRNFARRILKKLWAGFKEPKSAGTLKKWALGDGPDDVEANTVNLQGGNTMAKAKKTKAKASKPKKAKAKKSRKANLGELGATANQVTTESKPKRKKLPKNEQKFRKAIIDPIQAMNAMGIQRYIRPAKPDAKAHKLSQNELVGFLEYYYDSFHNTLRIKRAEAATTLESSYINPYVIFDIARSYGINADLKNKAQAIKAVSSAQGFQGAMIAAKEAGLPSKFISILNDIFSAIDFAAVYEDNAWVKHTIRAAYEVLKYANLKPDPQPDVKTFVMLVAYDKADKFEDSAEAKKAFPEVAGMQQQQSTGYFPTSTSLKGTSTPSGANVGPMQGYAQFGAGIPVDFDDLLDDVDLDGNGLGYMPRNDLDLIFNSRLLGQGTPRLQDNPFAQPLLGHDGNLGSMGNDQGAGIPAFTENKGFGQADPNQFLPDAGFGQGEIHGLGATETEKPVGLGTDNDNDVMSAYGL